MLWAGRMKASKDITYSASKVNCSMEKFATEHSFFIDVVAVVVLEKFTA